MTQQRSGRFRRDCVTGSNENGYPEPRSSTRHPPQPPGHGPRPGLLKPGAAQCATRSSPRPIRRKSTASP
ncbi:hypothetical protein [Lysobacter gummosus]|uniref:hypothetical protein n=1 Tax=Lysobacter gummosus TaxID=262324 RepID=UPI00362B2CAE